jgi:hypothetical protein
MLPGRWTVLRLQSSPVSTLSDAVGGDLSLSLMWRDVLSRYGIGDVASVVFADQFGCWGFLDLWRNDTNVPFSAADAGFIAAVAAPLATALRHCQAGTFVDPATPHRPDLGPVVLMLDDDPGWDYVNGTDYRNGMACRISCGYTWTAADPGWRAQVLPSNPA